MDNTSTTKQRGKNFSDKTLGRLFAFSLVALTISFAPEAHAEEKAMTPNTQLLSYWELMSLTEAKRAEYLLGVREMILEVSKISDANKSGLFAENAQEISSHTSLIDALLPQAFAATPRAPGKTRGSPSTTARRVTYDPADASAAPDQTCSDLNLVFVPIGKDAQGAVTGYCRTQAPENSSCPDGLIAVNQSEITGLFACASKRSFQALNETTQTTLTTPNPKATQETVANFTKYGKDRAAALKAAPTASTVPAPPPPTTGNTCSFEADKCEDREKFREELYKTNPPDVCIYGGNISKYANKTTQRCRPPMQYPLLSESCQGKTVLCNPLIFCGIPNEGSEKMKPLCVPRSMNATASCGEEAKKSDPDASCAGKFLANTTNGIKESWDEFAQGFNTLCRKKPARDFYCIECNVMKERLLKLNVKASGDDCGRLIPANYRQPAPPNKPRSATTAT